MRWLTITFLSLCLSSHVLGNNSSTVFRELAAYDVQSVRGSLKEWESSENVEDQLLKETAMAYLALLEGRKADAMVGISDVLAALPSEGSLEPKTAIYIDRLMGLYQFMDGNLDSAYTYYWPSLLLSREAYGERSVVYLDQLGLVIDLFVAQGKLVVAEEMLVRLISLTRKVFGKTATRVVELQAILGNLNTEMARFESAQGYFDLGTRQLDQYATAETQVARATILTQQARFYLIKGNFTVAEALNTQAIKLLELLFEAYHPLKSQAYLQEAKIYIAMNNLSEAGIRLSELVSYQKKYFSEKHPYFGRTLVVLAEVLMRQGYEESALGLVKNAESIFEQTLGRGHSDYCSLYLLKAQLANDPKRAESYYQQALTALQSNYGKSHYYLAEALSEYAMFLYDENKLQEAYEAERSALDIRTALFDFYHPDYTESLYALARIQLKAGNKKDAATYLRKSAENYLVQYNKYFAFLSEYEKGQFYERTRSFFDLYYYFSFFETEPEERQQWINEVFNYRLANKALLFQSVKNLKEAIYQLNDPALLEVYDLWIKTRENLSKLNKMEYDMLRTSMVDKDSLIELSNELEKQISLKVAISQSNTKETNILNWQTLAGALESNEVALEMIRIRDFDIEQGAFTDSVRYACLALNTEMTNGPKLVMFDEGNFMEDKALSIYRNAIKYKVADESSYATYWQPIGEQLKRHLRKEIFLSPDGVFNQINLNTLYDTESDAYFIDKFNVNLLSSLRDLIDSPVSVSSGDGSQQYLFYGYPIYQHHPINGKTQEPALIKKTEGGERSIHLEMRNMIGRGAEITLLPGTLEEVEAASKIVRGYVDQQVVTGTDATEDAIKELNGPELLHIATHGFFMDSEVEAIEPIIKDDLSEIKISNQYVNPLFNSGLMMAGSAHAYDSLVLREELRSLQTGKVMEDGIMTSYEVMNIDLRGTKLVVLSACETGLGKIESGEGVYGLQRAFQTAGSEAVVISLWKVSDEATKDLMTLFYQYFMDSQDSKSAFVKAQQSLRAKYPDPYYWGAFIYVGKGTESGVL